MSKTDELRKWALEGVRMRINTLETEARELRAQWPEAGVRVSADPFVLSLPAPGAAVASDRATPKRHNMTPAARKAVSQRMKKYWALRRKEPK